MSEVNFMEDIASDVVERIDSQVDAFRRVVLIGAPSEFEEMAVNPPTAGVICTRVENSDDDTPPGEEYVYITTEIWYTAPRFGIDHREAGISGDEGVYQLLAQIHGAMKGWTPTSGDEPMRFMESDVTDLSDGLVIAFADYRTARLI